MKRRGQNEGTIRRRPDGRWEARLNLGWTNGKRVRKSFYGVTREEVAKRLAEFSTQRDHGLPVPHGRETVGAFLRTWVEQVRPSVRPRTYETYDLYIRKALPAFDKLRLSDLRPDHIRALLVTKLKEGLSPRTVSHLRTILNTALTQAVNDKLLAWNPVTATKRPKGSTTNHKYVWFDRDQAKAFLIAARDSRYEAAFGVALALGLRLGEVLGLRQTDVDLDGRTIRIEQTIQRLRARIAGKAGYHVGAPKTKLSRRLIVVPEVLIPMLRRHRARQAELRLAAGTAWHDSGLVFTGRNGGPLDARALRTEFAALIERAGVSKVRFQDLRHSAASLLLAQGVSLRAVMELLGHSTITLTANTYGHVSKEMRADTAARMDSIIADDA
jgi:integrase